jgi:SRSO17 transposase
MIQPKIPQPTISFIDQYCGSYQKIFPEVRSYEAFKQIIMGILTPSKRKSLVTISKIIGLKNSQSLHNFLTQSPWEWEELRAERLKNIFNWLKEEAIDIIIDETGDPKKGNKTEYVARQYLGRLGKVDNGIVSVNIYGVRKGITFPLLFEVYKPKSRLKPGDKYQSKPQIAARLVEQLVSQGLKIRYVLADSLYGESVTNLLRVLEKMKLHFMVAIRSNHGVWMPEEEKVEQTAWQEFDRILSKGQRQKRYVCEIIFGQRSKYTYWYLTTDPETLPVNSTSYVMTNIDQIKYQDVGNIYGERTWIEYGFRQSKSELGWSDFHITKYNDIAKWWEVICCAFLLVSMRAISTQTSELSDLSNCQSELNNYLAEHPDWDCNQGWKSMLNNMQLLLLPLLALKLVEPWLKVFEAPLLVSSFNTLIGLVNLCANALTGTKLNTIHQFSSS